MATAKHPRPKTWSLLGEVRRKPTPYEVVTSNFHYHFRRDPAPFELDPDSAINRWYGRYREGSALQVDDWEAFRDPAKLTYKDYVALQHDREVYLDGIIDRFEERDELASLSPGWVGAAENLVIPLRFPLHVLQMVGLYVGQMAPTSYITNAAHFQAADEMRRIQRIAYWTKALANAHDEQLASTSTARGRWEDGAEWQPLRKVLEELLVAYDWGEAFAALNLAVKPALDAMVNLELAALGEANGDELLAALLADFDQDSRRSKNWTNALVAYVLGRDASLRKVLRSHLERWAPPAIEAVAALAPLFEQAPAGRPAAGVVEAARQAQAEVSTQLA